MLEVGACRCHSPMQCNKVRRCGGQAAALWAESQEASAAWSGVSRVGTGVWAPRCGAEHLKAE